MTMNEHPLVDLPPGDFDDVEFLGDDNIWRDGRPARARAYVCLRDGEVHVYAPDCALREAWKRAEFQWAPWKPIFPHRTTPATDSEEE